MAEARSEIAIQTLFRSRARIQCPAVVVVAIPNGALRGQKALNQARREGAAWGFPDVMCLWPGGGIAFIEFKTERGKLDANQVEWQARLGSMGHRCIVSRDPDHALEFLRECGAPFLIRRKPPAAPFAADVPEHLAAMQALVARCGSIEQRKEFIIAAHCAGAIDQGDTELLIQSNQLETA